MVVNEPKYICINNVWAWTLNIEHLTGLVGHCKKYSNNLHDLLAAKLSICPTKLALNTFESRLWSLSSSFWNECKWLRCVLNYNNPNHDFLWHLNSDFCQLLSWVYYDFCLLRNNLDVVVEANWICQVSQHWVCCTILKIRPGLNLNMLP